MEGGGRGSGKRGGEGAGSGAAEENQDQKWRIAGTGQVLGTASLFGI